MDSSNQPLPAAIVARWMGGNSSYVVSGSGSSIVLATDRLTITQSNQNDVALLNATASAPSPGTFRLVGFGGQGCPANGVGTYSWTLSPSGRVLSVQQVTEDCPNRGSAVAGTWYRMACRDPGTPCLGPLDAGTYPSQFLRPDLAATDTWAPKVGAMTYTVPQGWANYEDWPGWVGLTPIADFDRTTPNNLDPGVDIIVDAGVRAESQATPCSGTPDPKVGTTVAAILESIRHVRGLTVGPATSISIDGHAGVWADLTPDPSKIVPCGTDHVVEYLMAAGEGHGIGATERRRMFLLDLGSGHIVLIEIQALDPSRFAAFVPEAMPIVESFTFA